MNPRKNSRKRRGALTMELILIFPILMLLFILFYQVSVMLLTYHSLQTIASHAALAASTGTPADVETVVTNGAKSWYYVNVPEGQNLAASSSDEWKSESAGNFSFRILEGGTAWQYVSKTNGFSPTTSESNRVAVEIRLKKKGFQRYLLLPLFQGVEDGSGDLVVSASAIRN